MMRPKQLWLLTGGNGAGKSTFYRQFLEKRGLKIINADIIAAAINPDHPEIASYEAAALDEKLREQLLQQEVSFCFETVFPHVSEIDFVGKAKALGYQVVLVYIHLDSIDLNEARVYQRISEGGHMVPIDKIHSRIPRTMKHIQAVLPIVDEARLLDNSSRKDPFQQVAVVKQGSYTKMQEDLPCWAEELLENLQIKNTSN